MSALLCCARPHSSARATVEVATATRQHLSTMKASPARPGHRRHYIITLLALLAPAADGFARPPSVARIAAPPPRRPSCALRTRGKPLMFYQGGVLGVGTPEVLVIAAVGYFLLGPEELYRLSKEIGKVVGQAREYVTKSAAEPHCRHSYADAVRPCNRYTTTSLHDEGIANAPGPPEVLQAEAGCTDANALHARGWLRAAATHHKNRRAASSTTTSARPGAAHVLSGRRLGRRHA